MKRSIITALANKQVEGRRGEASRRGGERMEGSAVSPHRGGGGVTQGSKVERQKAGVSGKEWRRRRRRRGRRRRRSVDPAFTVSGCHLFTHSTVCIATLSEERQLHNVSSPQITLITKTSLTLALT